MTDCDEALGLSVILPAYMKNPTIPDILALRRSLESVLDEPAGGPCEIILIDDGSDPPIETFSPMLGPAYRDVKSIRHRQNQGVAAALNTGLRQARHELVARIDADDRWLAGKLGPQLALFRDADVTITGTGMIRVTPDDKKIDRHDRPENWHDILTFLCEIGCPFPHASVIGRRSIWRLLGGYPRDARFLHCEDLALWGIWLRFFKPAAIARPLLAHTVSDSAISSIHRESQLGGTKIITQRFRNLRLADHLPAAMRSLAESLDGSLTEAGRLAYMLWKHPYLAMQVPHAAVRQMETVLPDRLLEIVHDDAAPSWRSATGCSGADDLHDPVTIHAVVL